MNSEKKQDLDWKRNITGFLAGQGISLFGSQIVQMAIIYYVTLKTSSGFWVTALTLVALLPQVIMSLFAGVWADRYDRKKIIIISDSIIAIATLLLALFMMSGKTGTDVLIAIIIVSGIRSLGGGVHAPAVNAMIPQIVPEDRLSRVNGYNGTIQSIVQFVSPIAAGVILTVGSIHTILLIDVVTAIIGFSILALLKIPGYQAVERTQKTSVFTEMKEGLQFAWDHRFLRQLFTTYGLFILLSVPSGFLTILMIERTFGENVMFLTINDTVWFAGSVLGGLLLGITGGFKNRNLTLFFGLLVYGIATFALGFANIFWLFAVIMFFVGLTIPATQTSVFTLVQEKVDPSMMGRVFSLLNIMFNGFMALGMVIFGPMSDALRIQTMIIGCAVLTMILAFSIIITCDYYREGVKAKPLQETL